MKLYDYISLMKSDYELTVWDKDYDVEVYFYGGLPSDDWDWTMEDLAKILTITTIYPTGVVVNLSEVIEQHMEDLSDLFEDDIDIDIEDIMENANYIISGNVSEEWFRKFVDILMA